MGQKKWKMYKRFCKRCGEIFETEHKYPSACSDCHKNRLLTGRKENRLYQYITDNQEKLKKELYNKLNRSYS